MGESMNLIMVKTIVKKAIRGIKTDPERTTRNLIDMALNFADSRFRKEFYSSAQSLLTKESSGYYALVKDTITQINEDTLLTFGMNLGYNGLYEGAGKIRKAESMVGYNIPWTVSLTIAEGKVFDQHHRAIAQGEAMGIHTWQLFSQGGIFDCLAIAERHPDSAFVIFCNAHEISWSVLDYADDIRNIAIVVSFDKDADVVCDMLRVSGILYGISYTYAEKDLTAIESGELLHDIEQLHPAFSVLKPQFPCQKELRRRVYQWLTKARLEQEFHTILWELYSDMLLVDEIISDDPCWAGFDEYGQLHTEEGIDRTYGYNIFVNELPEVLKRAFPKQKGTF
jgi:hypothetical protein